MNLKFFVILPPFLGTKTNNEQQMVGALDCKSKLSDIFKAYCFILGFISDNDSNQS